MNKRKYDRELIEYIMKKRGIKYRSAIAFIKRHNLRTVDDARKLLENVEAKNEETENENVKVQNEQMNVQIENENEGIQEIKENINENFQIENRVISELLKEDNEEQGEQQESKFNKKFAERLVEVVHKLVYKLIIKGLLSFEFENERDLEELISDVKEVWVEEMERWGINVDSNVLTLIIIYGSYAMRLRRKTERESTKVQSKHSKLQVRKVQSAIEDTPKEEQEKREEQEEQNKEEQQNIFYVEDVPDE